MDYKSEYERWLCEVKDTELLNELRSMTEEQLEDAFYRDLVFGTGGLRGVLGAGTNRMNVYVVARASLGLAHVIGNDGSVVIGYDSRLKSEVFAKTAACVFAAAGLKVHLWPELLPVPTVSYAVRRLKASAGVMITASHNPAQYNGYKVYGSDGCQITMEVADAILNEINRLDLFHDSCTVPFADGLHNGSISWVNDDILTAFLEKIKDQSVLFGDEIDRNVDIVYSPLNGTGLKPVTRALQEAGFQNVTVVKEQEEPDGLFPTCPYPNPEIPEAMELGLQYCERVNADLLLATDPDCDRCGIAVRREDGSYQLLSGNEVGLLLLDYVCAQRTKHGEMPPHPVFIKTIVTTALAEKIASFYGVHTINVLTGFKFIGETIGRMEDERNYICGFEESYGYLTGSYVRDKDGVGAAFMIAEMFAFYKTRGISLLEKLSELYDTHGFCLDTLHSYEFPGHAGMKKMTEIMGTFRGGLRQFGGQMVLRTEDYSLGLNGLPKSDVLKFYLDRGTLVVRPSGTEPKLKAYTSITAENMQQAKKIEKAVTADLTSLMSL